MSGPDFERWLLRWHTVLANVSCYATLFPVASPYKMCISTNYKIFLHRVCISIIYQLERMPYPPVIVMQTSTPVSLSWDAVAHHITGDYRSLCADVFGHTPGPCFSCRMVVRFDFYMWHMFSKTLFYKYCKVAWKFRRLKQDLLRIIQQKRALVSGTLFATVIKLVTKLIKGTGEKEEH